MSSVCCIPTFSCHLLDELRWWQYTTTARKIAALSYWSSPFFECLLLLCTVLSKYVRGKITSSPQTFVRGAERQLHIVDCVFTAYVVVAAILNQRLHFLLVYLMLYIFLYSYSEIEYMAIHLFFLSVFCTLY